MGAAARGKRLRGVVARVCVCVWGGGAAHMARFTAGDCDRRAYRVDEAVLAYMLVLRL